MKQIGLDNLGLKASEECVSVDSGKYFHGYIHFLSIQAQKSSYDLVPRLFF